MATTDWIHAVHVICDAASVGGAIAALDIAFPCDDGLARNPATPANYGCQLSANGELPATHYGSSFVVTEQIRANLENLGLASVPGVTYWRCTNPGGVLVVTNHASGGPIGQQFGFDDAVAALSLSCVVISIEGV
jgi:hypothetical protein